MSPSFWMIRPGPAISSERQSAPIFVGFFVMLSVLIGPPEIADLPFTMKGNEPFGLAPVLGA